MERKLARLGKRLFAYMLDIIPIGFIFYGIFYAFFGFDETWHNYIADKQDLDAKVQFLRERSMIRDVSFFVFLLYGTFMECSKFQGTFGKYLMKIRITEYEGNRISFMQSVKRNLFKFVSILPLGLGFIWAAFDKDRRTWHDMIAKTIVQE